MRTTTCTRALLASALRNPLLALVGASAVGTWWVLDRALPFGLTTGSTHELAVAYEVAFLAGSVACSILVATGIRYRAALEPAGPGARLLGTGLAAVLAAGALGALVLIPAHLSRTWQGVPFDVDASLPALLLGWLHLTALALACAEFLEPPGARSRNPVRAPALALLLGFALPAALPAVGTLFDVSGPLGMSFDLSSDGAHWSAPFWSTVLWGSLAVARALPTRVRSLPRATPCATRSSVTSTRT